MEPKNRNIPRPTEPGLWWFCGTQTVPAQFVSVDLSLNLGFRIKENIALPLPRGFWDGPYRHDPPPNMQIPIPLSEGIAILSVPYPLTPASWEKIYKILSVYEPIQAMAGEG
jgi:hypothetical protein